jgi:hypothetical protein
MFVYAQLAPCVAIVVTMDVDVWLIMGIFGRIEGSSAARIQGTVSGLLHRAIKEE